MKDSESGVNEGEGGSPKEDQEGVGVVLVGVSEMYSVRETDLIRRRKFRQEKSHSR